MPSKKKTKIAKPAPGKGEEKGGKRSPKEKKKEREPSPEEEKNEEGEAPSQKQGHLFFHQRRVNSLRLNNTDHNMCILCRKDDGVLLSCALSDKKPRCNCKFHESCVYEYNAADYSVEDFKKLLETEDIRCPLHHCDVCLFERRKTTAFLGEFVECHRCYRAFHMKCRPAGVKLETIQGKEYTCCHVHTTPENIEPSANQKKGTSSVSKKKEKKKEKEKKKPKPVQKKEKKKLSKVAMAARILYCCECEEEDQNGDLTQCQNCMQSFHQRCVRSIRGEQGRCEKMKGPFCECCVIGDSFRVGQAVIAYYDKKHFPAVVVDISEVPETCKKRDRHRKFFGLPGYLALRWAGCANMFNLVKVEHILPMFPGSHEIYPKHQDNDFNIAWKELELLPPVRPNFPYTMINKYCLQYKKIEFCVLGKTCPKVDLPWVDSATNDNCTCKAVDGEERCGENCTNRMDFFECPESCKNRPGICMNRGVAEKKMHPGVELKMTEKKGYGLFTSQVIKAGSFIAEYAGELISKEEEVKRTEIPAMLRNNEEVHYMMSLDSKRTIDCKHMGNMARFINHSCDPNCMVKLMDIPIREKKNKGQVQYDKRVAIYAIRKIEEEEELTFDYQMEEYIGCSLPECLCGSDICRGQMGRVKTEKKAVASSSKQKSKKVSAVVEKEKEDGDMAEEEKKEEDREKSPDVEEIEMAEEEKAESAPKRRGRPRKVKVEPKDENEVVEEKEAAPPAVKRARGAAQAMPLRELQAKEESGVVPAKKKRGRPPKNIKVEAKEEQYKYGGMNAENAMEEDDEEPLNLEREEEDENDLDMDTANHESFH